MKKGKKSSPKSMRGQAEQLAKKLANPLANNSSKLPPVVKSTAVTPAAMTQTAANIVDAGLGGQGSHGRVQPKGWPDVFGGNQAADLASDNENEDESDDMSEDAASLDAAEAGDASRKLAPPDDWSDEAKGYFADLPEVVQNAIVQHEKTHHDTVSAHRQDTANCLAEVNKVLAALLEHGVGFDSTLRDAVGIDWNDLSRTNPQVYAEKFPEFNRKIALLNHLKEQNDAAKALRDKHQQALETQALLEKLPELQDPALRTQIIALVARHAPAWGFDPQDLTQVKDHRVSLMAMDAAKHRDQQQAAKQFPAKRVGAVPLSLKPGAGQKSSRTANLDQLKAEAMRSGSMRKQADYIMRVLQSK
ncbi:MAG: hypothetical protein QM537_09945 [Candidatus Symbiobacter sp.]|nr:hypothetical protein [Candidatus Symbiobacter sp.]